jgi:hypothetical protein
MDAACPGSGGTAFICACYHDRADCAEALARAGCDVMVKEKRGLTGREVVGGLGRIVALYSRSSTLYQIR